MTIKKQKLIEIYSTIYGTVAKPKRKNSEKRKNENMYIS
jgi:hypothetical protein